MIMQDEPGCMAQMVALYEKTGGNIVAVQECDPAEAHKYGIVGRGRGAGDGFEITEMVEKPPKGTAPSNFYLNGRYILQPEIFDILAGQERGAGNEIQLTDGMLKLKDRQDFYAYPFAGRTFDCGSPEGFVEANIALSLLRDDMKERIGGSLASLLAEAEATRKKRSRA